MVTLTMMLLQFYNFMPLLIAWAEGCEFSGALDRPNTCNKTQSNATESHLFVDVCSLLALARQYQLPCTNNKNSLILRCYFIYIYAVVGYMLFSSWLLE